MEFSEVLKINKIEILQDKIYSLDKAISSIAASRNANKIKESYSNLSDSGCFSIKKMWSVKKKLNLNNNDVPTAKFDNFGNLITSRKSLLLMYENEYKLRLEEKQPWKGYEEMHSLHEQLFNFRNKIALQRKTENWKISQILSVCEKLKNSKARDRHGMVYELFKPQFAGEDLHFSLMTLFNLIKEKMIIPDFLQIMSITSFTKSRGNRNLISHERGVFNLPKLHSILNHLIYNECYEVIDKNLSYSNAGGRKGRSIRDHLFSCALG